jgi:hypothetical protein
MSAFGDTSSHADPSQMSDEPTESAPRMEYEQWKDFRMPARGIGLLALVVAETWVMPLAWQGP